MSNKTTKRFLRNDKSDLQKRIIDSDLQNNVVQKKIGSIKSY